MNLLENEEVASKNKKTKLIMTIIIIMIAILVAICVGLVIMLNNIQTNMLKLTIDAKSQSKFSDKMFVIEDNTIYVSIEDFAPLVGYSVYRGDHKSESDTKGYIQSSFEEASFELNSNQITKTIIGETDSEYYTIDKAVKNINNKLYMSAEGMQIAANCLINYSSKTNQYTAYSLTYLTTYYPTKILDASLEDFSNQKALLQNMIVVKNANGNLGVRTFDGKEVIGTKYTNIKFIESSKDFIVTTADKKMGILASDGSTKVQANYDDIKQLDKESKLYLVKSNNKYGVINEVGNTVIYTEYDKIGVDAATFAGNEIKNPYFIFNKYIPVQKDKKWGLFDKSGNLALKLNYDELGCSTAKKGNNILFVPEREYLVVGQNKKYGIVNNQAKELIPCQLDSMYAVVNSGKTTYYMSQGTNEVEIISYMEKYGYDVKKEDMSIVNNTTSNTEANKTTQTSTIPTEVTNSTSGNTVSSNNTNSVTVQSNTVNGGQTNANVPSSQTNSVAPSYGNVTSSNTGSAQ